jgi:hypothetical protein
MEHFYQNIDGFMNERNTMMLDIVIDQMPSNCQWVELGSWTGKSAAYCAVELINKNKFGRFVTVDSWSGGVELQEHGLIKNKSIKDVFLENISPLVDKIETLQSISWDAAISFEDNSLDFCYVDAGHTYEDVTKDLTAWWPKIKSGTYFGGDDYTKGYPGLQQAVWDFFRPKNIKVNRSGRCWLIRKP